MCNKLYSKTDLLKSVGLLRTCGGGWREAVVERDVHVVAAALDHVDVALGAVDDVQLARLGRRRQLGRVLRVHLNESLARRQALHHTDHATAVTIGRIFALRVHLNESLARRQALHHTSTSLVHSA